MSARRYEMTAGTADKFWEVEQDGASLTTRWGRRGTQGQSKTKAYASEAAAAADAEKQIGKKTAKGYVPAGEGSPSGEPATADAVGVAAAAPTVTTAASTAADGQVRDLADGEKAEVPGSGGRSYTLSNVGGVYACTCPAWRNQSLHIDRRTCKHLRRFRGEAAEEARLGELPQRATGGANNPDAPQLLLAETWDRRDPTGWWMSEKLDGVRAYWDGKRFLSRLGNEFLAPEWFTEGLPDAPLDGELFGGRGEFQATVSVARRADRGEAWRRLSFVVFDAPAHDGPFEARLDHLRESAAAWGHATALEQIPCRGVEHLDEALRKVEALGGEGLMLRRPGSRYVQGRSETLLKVKTFHDAEARVVGHQAGSGRHKGRLGALQVVLANGTRFKVGTGFTDAQREDPPAVGETITFRYQELTKDGVPRFPTFVGVRHDVVLEETPPLES